MFNDNYLKKDILEILPEIQKQPPDMFHKKMFFEILQNSQEIAVSESLL